MAQDTIVVFKVLFPKKALINGKSSKYTKRLWKIFERKVLTASRENFDRTNIMKMFYYTGSNVKNLNKK